MKLPYNLSAHARLAFFGRYFKRAGWCNSVAWAIRLGCAVFTISESCYRYQPRLNSESEHIANWLIRLTDNNRSCGFDLCYLYPRNVKDFGWSHKRIYRIYRELELNLRIKARKRLVRDKP